MRTTNHNGVSKKIASVCAEPDTWQDCKAEAIGPIHSKISNLHNVTAISQPRYNYEFYDLRLKLKYSIQFPAPSTNKNKYKNVGIK